MCFNQIHRALHGDLWRLKQFSHLNEKKKKKKTITLSTNTFKLIIRLVQGPFSKQNFDLHETESSLLGSPFYCHAAHKLENSNVHNRKRNVFVFPLDISVVDIRKKVILCHL